MSLSQSSNLPSNWLLDALPFEVRQRLEPNLELVSLSLGEILYDTNEQISNLYFPCSAAISLIYPMEDGAIIEVGLVGVEGMVGLPALLGGTTKTHQANVQVAGFATRIPTEIIRAEFRKEGALQDLLLRYIQSFFGQVSLTAVSNRFYTVEERLARWLLIVSDCVQSETFLLTQELISNMLGVRRAGVTVAAGALSQSGLIRYSRGKIAILDRQALEEFCGECYTIGQAELRQMLGNKLTKDKI